MGQDLWGQSRGQAAKNPGTISSSIANIASTSGSTGWPTSNGLSSTHSSWSSGGNGPSSGPAWLLLKNLTAQIDGSTLRTLCMQHGPLHNFHLYLPHGIALVKYSNGQEAKKAQNALNNCVLGNTTILAETTGEQDVETILRTLGQHGNNPAPTPSTPRGSTPATPFSSGAPMSSMAGYGSSLAKSSSTDTWSAHAGGLSLGWPSSSIGGSVWGAPDDQHNRTTPLHSFLPPDLLSEGTI
jgi:trinucleotide repeat-containing gene 6 protein